MGSVDWQGIVSNEDLQSLWDCLYYLLSNRAQLGPGPGSTAEIEHSDRVASLTQEIVLELLVERRLEYFTSLGYSSERIEKYLLDAALNRLGDADGSQGSQAASQRQIQSSLLAQASAGYREY
ncbi:MAG TPA: hypothetical protein VJX67_18070 [Blastocatellia bacterium]|nr:hypothetical protein [Blastocatellia bacterium]